MVHIVMDSLTQESEHTNRIALSYCKRRNIGDTFNFGGLVMSN